MAKSAGTTNGRGTGLFASGILTDMWSKRHPSEPGWYWFRRTAGHLIEAVYFRGDNFLRVGILENNDPRKVTGDWWSEPIPVVSD